MLQNIIKQERKDMNGFVKLGNTIKYYRNKRNLDIQTMAQKLNISTKRMQDIENGKVTYTFATLEKIASILEVTLPDLLNFSQN